MPPLHRAIALAKMDGMAERVAEHLDFDVARIENRALQNDGRIAERALRLGSRAAQRIRKGRRIRNQPHAATAAAGDGLDHHGESDVFRLREHRGVALIRTLITRHTGHAGRPHDGLGAGLVAQRLDGFGRRPDKHQARIPAGAGEILVFGQKAVTRMNRIRSTGFCRGHDRFNPEIGLRRQRLADADGLIRAVHMQCVTVGVRIDGDHTVAETARGPHDPQRDLAAIGDQDVTEWFALHRPAAHGRATENCMRWGERCSASRQIASTSANIARVSRGSITPSSSTRALVENTSIWPSNTPMICAFI